MTTEGEDLNSYAEIRQVLRADAPWLAAEDLDGELVVTIDRPLKHLDAIMEDGKRTVAALHFQDHDKAMVLNSINATQLEEMFGRVTKKWHGQTITLYSSKLDKPAFGRKYGLRIKEQ